MSYRRGDLALAPFVYADLGGRKRRPVCVVSVDRYQSGPDVIVAMITSNRNRLQRPGLGDVVLTDWQRSGLLAPSVARTGRLQVIEQRLLSAPIGHLDDDTMTQIDAGLRDVLGI